MTHGKSEEDWGKLLDHLAQRTGVGAARTDAEGNIVQSSGEHTSLCRKVRDNKTALTFICAQTSKAILAEIRQTLQPSVHLCEGGLLRLAVPIVRDGSLVGQLTSCGALQDPDEVDPFFISQQAEVAEDVVKAEIERLPTSTPEHFEQVARDVFTEVNG